MGNKTCASCKHFNCGFCEFLDLATFYDRESCSNYADKQLTNGDKIRQMSNEELVAFFITRDASYCVPDASPGDCEASKDCEDHWLRWLNAPACVAENGESAKQTDLCCKVDTESEGEDE